MLSGKKILKNVIENKGISIKPFNEKQLGPNSYNLRLHNKLMVYKNDILDIKKENETKLIEIPEDGMVLEPLKLYLGRTIEYTKTDKYIPGLEGRSSIGRLGMFVHVSAGFGDVGYSGYWTLEIFCLQPVKIYPGVEVCQIYYEPIQGDYEKYNSNKYQNNKGVQPSLLYKDFKKENNMLKDVEF